MNLFIPILAVFILWMLSISDNGGKCPKCGQEMIESGYNGWMKCENKKCEMYNVRV